jgi:hypothetical protein
MNTGKRHFFYCSVAGTRSPSDRSDYGSNPQMNGSTVLCRKPIHIPKSQPVGSLCRDNHCRSLRPLLCQGPRHPITITTLIDPAVDHPGAGSYLIDNVVSNETSRHATRAMERSSYRTNPKKRKGPRVLFEAIFLRHGKMDSSDFKVFDTLTMVVWRSIGVPHMRFITRKRALSSCRMLTCVESMPSGKSEVLYLSLYLTDCERGGLTTLLKAHWVPCITASCSNVDACSCFLTTVLMKVKEAHDAPKIPSVEGARKRTKDTGQLSYGI